MLGTLAGPSSLLEGLVDKAEAILIFSHCWAPSRARIFFTGEFASSSGKGISALSTMAFKPEFQY